MEISQSDFICDIFLVKVVEHGASKSEFPYLTSLRRRQLKSEKFLTKKHQGLDKHQLNTSKN